MTPHSNILVWEIPQTVEPGMLQSMGLQRVRQNRTSEHVYIYILFIPLHYSLLQDIEYCSFATTVGSPQFIGVYLLIPSPNFSIPPKLW